EHQCYLFFILTKNKALNNSKYVNPFRKVSKSIVQEMDDTISTFISSVSDSVSFINNSRKMTFTPMDAVGIHALTNNFYNGFNHGFDTDILLEKNSTNIGEHYFDVLSVNS